MKVTIDLDIWEEISVDEITEELVIRPRAAMMDSLLDFPEEEPEWNGVPQMLEEQLIQPYIVPNSNVVPDEDDYHMMLAASKDLFKIAQGFKERVDKLRIMSPEEHKKTSRS
jgi:hypothetical protein|tara:strand:+ start:60 stop:395 length:336 start_codon:yes stop_codon:yes gene_type:complete